MKVKEYFNTLFIIYVALLAGLLIFMSIAVFLSNSGSIEPLLADMSDLFLIIVAVVVMGGAFAGNYIYRTQMKSISELTNYSEQFLKVKSLKIAQLALLEGPSILTIVFYMLTGSWYFLLFFVLTIFLFGKIKPDKGKIISDMKLSEELKKQMEDPTFKLTEETKY